MTEKIGQVAIIGAGPSGVAAGKNCKQTGLEFVIFDQNSAVGGNWLFSEDEGHSSVYESSHIISSKIWSQYEDFPMPDDYPDYPSHRQLQRYFADYAEHWQQFMNGMQWEPAATLPGVVDQLPGLF